jgi:flagellar motor switch protein FliN/FliY
MRGLNVQPFSLEGLPRLPRAAVPWTRALARARAAFPRRLDLELRGLGSIQVRPTRVGFFPDPERAGEAFALEVRGLPARLYLDLPLALRLVSGLTGTRSATAVRALTAGERGVLASVIVAVLDAAGLAGTVRLSLGQPPPLEGDLLTLGLRVEGAGTAGQARLELPPTAIPARSVAAPAWSRRAAAVPAATVGDLARAAVAVSLELARTVISGAELAAARPGDAVAFDAAAPLGEVWSVDVRFGDCLIPAGLHPDGRLQPRGPLGGSGNEVVMSTERNTVPDASAPLTDEAARVLAAAPVEIVAEVGRLNLRGEELVGLLEGGVLSLGPRRPAQVSLRVGGRLWAVGELVAIDDELGVRITELVGRSE